MCRQAVGRPDGWTVLLSLLCFLLLAPPLAAQDTSLEASRRRLQEIRRERDRLEQQQERLQGQVHDVNDELSNLERQRESTQRIVNEIEHQIGGLANQLDRSSAELILAEDNLAERRAVLERRRQQLARLAAQLDALSPLRVLQRGYAVPTGTDGHVLKRRAEFAPDMPFTLRVADGSIAARVESR